MGEAKHSKIVGDFCGYFDLNWAWGICKRQRCKGTKQGRKVQPRNLSWEKSFHGQLVVVMTLDSEEKSDRFIADSNVSSHYPFFLQETTLQNEIVGSWNWPLEFRCACSH